MGVALERLSVGSRGVTLNGKFLGQDLPAVRVTGALMCHVCWFGGHGPLACLSRRAVQYGLVSSMGIGPVYVLSLGYVGVFRCHYGLKHLLVIFVSVETVGRRKTCYGKHAYDDVGTVG